MFVEGVKVFCFGASYAVALASDASAAWVESKWRRRISLGFASAGVTAHTIYLAYRALGRDVTPLSTGFDSLLVVAWVLAVAYLFLQWHYPNLGLGVFALPLVLGLIGLAAWFGEDNRRPLEGWSQVWGPAHGAVLAAGALAIAAGFLAGLMYLVQAGRLKAKQLPSGGMDLPSLELLDRINRAALAAGFLLLTLGLGVGFLLAAGEVRRGNASIRWDDPKVISAVALWILLGVLVLVRREPQLRGRKLALLTIVAFGLLLFTIVGVHLLFHSWHQPVPHARLQTKSRVLRRPAQGRDPSDAAPCLGCANELPGSRLFASQATWGAL